MSFVTNMWQLWMSFVGGTAGIRYHQHRKGPGQRGHTDGPRQARLGSSCRPPQASSTGNRWASALNRPSWPATAMEQRKGTVMTTRDNAMRFRCSHTRLILMGPLALTLGMGTGHSDGAARIRPMQTIPIAGGTTGATYWSQSPQARATGWLCCKRRLRPSRQRRDRIRPWPENPHYLAWGDAPVFLLGATGYHSWTPISRPGTVDFEEQLDRLAAVMAEIGSRHVCGFVRYLPYDPMNHIHDGTGRGL
jgi:hypothetical protein